MAADKNAFVWEDPFLIEDQLSEDERMVRDGAAAFTVGNRAFVLTGRSGSLYLDNMFEFNPYAEKVDGD